MQMFNSPYKTCLHCLREVHAREGVRAFYRSYTTQLSMNIPFQSIHFMVYEFCQDNLNPHRQYNPHSHWISGALAGAFAAAATTPLDVCKTLLNTQEKCAISQTEASVDGLMQAFRTVYHYQGLRGYFRGVSARVIYQMPSTAISWSVYEFFKYRISRRDGESLVTPPKVHCAPPSQ
jgi:solute carrier family 25 iron transporter 28/37